MKTVFMGTPDFAVPALRALVSSGHEVAAVVTQPDRPMGRRGVLGMPPVKEEAVRLGLDVLQPSRVRDAEFAGILREISPDIVVVAAFGQIIPGEILGLPKYGCVNIHASLLPKYRGAAPIQWALLDGEKETGVTIMQMGEGLDTGDILAVRRVGISPGETGGSLFDKLSACGAELLAEVLPEIEKGTVRPVPQPAESPTGYARMISKEDGRIDWTLSAEEIERRVRALDPWPSAFTTLDGKTCKVWKSTAEDMETYSHENDIIKSEPGTVVSASDGRIVVTTGRGLLAVEELQIEGKKRMKAADFLRGRRLDTGTRFL